MKYLAMIFLKKFKQYLAETPEYLSSDVFLKMHKYVEGYLRRLELIGLRLNNVQYKSAQELISLTYLNNRALLQAVFKLLSKGNKRLEELEATYPDLKILIKLFFEFSSIYRNRLVHGVLEEIHDEETLKYCYLVDKSFVLELERVLELEFGHSAFDKPKKWGATTIRSTETIDQIRRRLKLGSLVKSPLATKTVIQHLKNTQYQSNLN